MKPSAWMPPRKSPFPLGPFRTLGTSTGRQLPRGLERFARGQATGVADPLRMNRFHRHLVHKTGRPRGRIAGRNGYPQNEVQTVLAPQPDPYVVQERGEGKDVQALDPPRPEESVPRRGVPDPAIAGSPAPRLKSAAVEEVEFRAETRPGNLIKKPN